MYVLVQVPPLLVLIPFIICPFSSFTVWSLMPKIFFHHCIKKQNYSYNVFLHVNLLSSIIQDSYLLAHRYNSVKMKGKKKTTTKQPLIHSNSSRHLGFSAHIKEKQTGKLCREQMYFRYNRRVSTLHQKSSPNVVKWQCNYRRIDFMFSGYIKNKVQWKESVSQKKKVI